MSDPGEDIVAIIFGVVIFLFGLALTIYYWQLMIPFWIASIASAFLKDKKFSNTIAFGIFLLLAWVLFSQFPPSQKASDTYCSWRDCPDEPGDRGASGNCGKFCGE